MGEPLVGIEWSLVEVSIRRNSLVGIHVWIERSIHVWWSLSELMSHLVEVRVVVVVRIERLIHRDLLKLVHRDLLIRVVLWWDVHWINLIGKRLSIWLVVQVLRHLVAILRGNHSGRRLLIIVLMLIVSERERVLIIWLGGLVVLRRKISLALSLYFRSQLFVLELLNHQQDFLVEFSLTFNTDNQLGVIESLYLL